MDIKYKPNKHTPIKNRLPTIGWGPFRFQWYSICSGHSANADGKYYEFDVDCDRCMAGTWINCWKHKIEDHIYDYDPELWRLWANTSLMRVLFDPLIKRVKNKNAK